MIVSRQGIRPSRKPIAAAYFFVTLRELLAARYGEPVRQERCDERGELWSLAGLLVALDVLSVREVAIIMMDGSRPGYKRVRLDEAGLREALEHIM